MRIKKNDGVKARLLAQLCYWDQDFKFEYAVMGLETTLKAYTQRELKRRLEAVKNPKISRTIHLNFTTGQHWETQT